MASSVIRTCLRALLVASVASQDPLAGVTTAPSTGNVNGAPQDMFGGVATQAPPGSVVPGAATQGTTVNPLLSILPQNPELETAEQERESSAFIDGFIVAYLDRVTLDPGEKDCLRKDIRKIGEHGVSIVKMLIKMVSGFIGKTPNAGTEVLDGMSTLGQVMSIVTRVQMLGDGCVEDDTMAVLKVSLKHLKNVTYVQSRLEANALEIMEVIADAAPEIRSKNYEKAGEDFGSVLRYIILSSHYEPPKMVLPNGMTKEQVGPMIMEGVIQGFFVTGSNLTMYDATNPSIRVFVDLHRCIAKEAKYFSSAINALYLFIAEMSTGIEEMKLRSEGIKTSESSENKLAWLGQLSGLLANVPTLMSRCGMTQVQMEDFGKVLANIKDMQISLSVPGPAGDQTAAGVEASEKIKEATEYYEAGNYLFFGEMVGSSLRDLLLAVDPQLYAVDSHGRLYRRGALSRSLSRSLPLFVGAFAAVSFTGLSLLRVVKRNRRDSFYLDAEGRNDDMEALRPHLAVE